MLRTARKSYGARTPPAIDGAKAKRAAQQLLRDARNLDNITAESLSRSWGLSLPVATQMLADEGRRRG